MSSSSSSSTSSPDTSTTVTPKSASKRGGKKFKEEEEVVVRKATEEEKKDEDEEKEKEEEEGEGEEAQGKSKGKGNGNGKGKGKVVQERIPTCPLTPQSELKLLEDLSPSFGIGAVPSASGNRYGTAHALPPFSYGVSSPFIPFSQLSSSKMAPVPSSREWFNTSSGGGDGDGSNGSSNSSSSSSGGGVSSESEWSNSIPEFSFSDAGSPVMGPFSSSSSASSSSEGVSQRRAKGGLETNFGRLFMEPPLPLYLGPDSASQRHGSDLEDADGRTDDDGSFSRRRRRKRVLGGDGFEGLGGKGSSPQHFATLHAVTPEGEVRIRCNCKRSKCLKLYCDCLRANSYCEGCNCHDCSNLERYSLERSIAVKNIMERNPLAFKARIAADPLSNSKEHLSGCHCKKSMCLKKWVKTDPSCP